MITGRILHLQRLSTEDGPGIRTTVFFKGCPLHCAWCHNPESISSRLQTQWIALRCLGCQTCVQTCPDGCLMMTDSGLVIDRQRCQACGKCAEACPSGALEALGKTVIVEELLGELLKDRAYYEKSGGGVTLSGGEPTFQPEFVEALLHGLKEQRISTALDTCGLCTTHTLERLLPFVDLVLFDMKLLDSQYHQEYTGVSNERILDNLDYIADYIRHAERPIQLWIRTPLIPGMTSGTTNIHAIGSYLAAHVNGVLSRWELCAFNNLCREQYKRLGLDWAFANTPLMSAEELADCALVARASGIHPDLIHTTGATRFIDTE
jgi:pyruvate formate lyase activating enzyme